MYDPDRFIRLTDEVERQGGASLPDICCGDEYHLKQPDVEGGMIWTDIRTTWCNEFTRFVIPYDCGAAVEVPQAEWSGEPGDRKMKRLDPVEVSAPPQTEIAKQIQRGGRFATVCAQDDLVHLWPRFANATKEN